MYKITNFEILAEGISAIAFFATVMYFFKYTQYDNSRRLLYLIVFFIGCMVLPFNVFHPNYTTDNGWPPVTHLSIYVFILAITGLAGMIFGIINKPKNENRGYKYETSMQKILKIFLFAFVVISAINYNFREITKWEVIYLLGFLLVGICFGIRIRGQVSLFNKYAKDLIETKDNLRKNKNRYAFHISELNKKIHIAETDMQKEKRTEIEKKYTNRIHEDERKIKNLTSDKNSANSELLIALTLFCAVWFLITITISEKIMPLKFSFITTTYCLSIIAMMISESLAYKSKKVVGVEFIPNNTNSNNPTPTYAEN